MHVTKPKLHEVVWPFNHACDPHKPHYMHVTLLAQLQLLACKWFSPSLRCMVLPILQMVQLSLLTNNALARCTCLVGSNGGTACSLVSQEAMAGHVPRQHVPPLLLAAWVRGMLPTIGAGGTLTSQPRHHSSHHCFRWHLHLAIASGGTHTTEARALFVSRLS